MNPSPLFSRSMRFLGAVSLLLFPLVILPSTSLAASGSVEVNATSIEDGPGGHGSYVTQQTWKNTSAAPLTLEFDDGSTLALPANQVASKNISKTTSYHLVENPSVTSKVVIYAPLTKGATTSTSVALSWGADSLGGNSSQVTYTLYRDGNTITSLKNISYTDTGLTPGTTYTYYVESSSPNGVLTTNNLVVSIPGSTPPNPPTNLRASMSGTSGELSWTASTGNNPISEYLIFLDGKQIDATSATRYPLKDLAAGKTYTYTVKAKDSQGLVSESSSNAAVKVEAAATPPPTATPAPTPKSSASPPPSPTPLVSAGSLQLTKISVDGKEFAPDPRNVLRVAIGTPISLEGKADPNEKLVLTIYSTKQTYETTADAQGNWAYELPTSSLEIGDHHITLAIQEKDGSVGEEVELLQFNLADPAATNETVTAKNTLGTIALGGIILFGLAFLVSGFVLLRGYLRKRRSNLNIAGTAASS